MTMFKDNETIVAIATAPGRGGIGVVRLSGQEALAIALKVLYRNKPLQPRYAHFSAFFDVAGEQIDEGLVIYFPGPASFTGEDVVELQGHGGPVILDLLVKTCVSHGARQAQPGEFSLRAFLNDRIDLTQAEAIADLIDAGSTAAAKAAMHSLQGDFSREINNLVEALIQLRMYVEAAIDFPEEEIDFLGDGKILEQLKALILRIDEVLQTARRGRLLREGMTVVIAGRPNAGKSSLLNALAGHESAIVTDIAGTTRDVLRESIQIDGLPLNIIDTAGLRESPDLIEQEGIRRAWAEIDKADFLLVMVDVTNLPKEIVSLGDVLPDHEQRLSSLTVPVLLVMNKIDLINPKENEIAENKTLPFDVITISARTGEGLDELRSSLKQKIGYHDTQESPFSARRRHLTALESALLLLRRGEEQLDHHRAGELLAEDLREAQKKLEEITGAYSADDLLGRIFSSFCIGK